MKTGCQDEKKKKKEEKEEEEENTVLLFTLCGKFKNDNDDQFSR